MRHLPIKIGCGYRNNNFHMKLDFATSDYVNRNIISSSKNKVSNLVTIAHALACNHYIKLKWIRSIVSWIRLGGRFFIFPFHADYLKYI